MWNAKALADALNAEMFETEIFGENALSVTLKQHADLRVGIVMNGDYMTAEAVIAGVNEVKDPALLNLQLLRATKALNLSSFALEQIGDEEHYVILGESSSSSTIENVELELNTLAANAFEVAELIEEHNKQ
ncbi:DUF2170 family protein [Vibrio crassostreae]|uniref:DUF2170 family protein n=1 Tax=Vibrio crassostreae TaxID=246167 RepID=UPI001B30F44F|nr:DUF2170 family protein [Vibrio crassostreae]